MSKVLFISQNTFKFQELEPLIQENKVDIEYINMSIKEIQSSDFKEIIKDKTLKAFTIFGQPIIVDHTGLFIEALNGFPAGITQLFWDKLGGTKICRILDNFENKKAIARTIFGFCDGRKLLIDEFKGELIGTISKNPHNGREFQWGTIFIPHGAHRAYSEICIEEVNKISHRSIAFKKLLKYLKGNDYIP